MQTEGNQNRYAQLSHEALARRGIRDAREKKSPPSSGDQKPKIRNRNGRGTIKLNSNKETHLRMGSKMMRENSGLVKEERHGQRARGERESSAVLGDERES